ncbi:hypothetical protein DYI24_15205 [Rhodopseudomonas sp. BR0C11]|uniref:P63C domain-containing protein n=1 Tax=Rhodopseudomonas sp. BR0C11 TaxID=2269370 RepID=UPI0013E0967D|nr:P63C domain-containing protein [Rhodopseudomonas sp. BR0C11]NEV78389.1 hypothetical protein [Rhodopseudomonas sp. BR0C11]
MVGEPNPDKVKAARVRAEVLSPERRAEIAQKAAAARWSAKLPRATHRGSFKEEFGIDVECYVLDDQHKTAVISQRGMAATLGINVTSGAAFPRFLASRSMAWAVDAELKQKIENPLKFLGGTGGVEQPPKPVYGFDVTLLIDVCNAIIKAESAGHLRAESHKGVARQAHIILSASAKSGIQGLVYRLAGYNPTAEEVIAAFKLYVQEEAKKYEPEFPNELYAAWYRLYKIPPLARGKPWHFKYLTVNHIYHPLAQSNGKVLELLRALKSRGGDQKAKLFQFLNQIGARALRIQLGRVLEMAESSPNKDAYERKIVERFGGQKEFEFIIPPPAETLEAAH